MSRWTYHAAFRRSLTAVVLDAVIALAPDGIARMEPVSIYGWSLLFAAACVVVLTLGMGCVPIRQEDSPLLARRHRGCLSVSGRTPPYTAAPTKATGEPRHTTRLTRSQWWLPEAIGPVSTGETSTS